MTTARNHRPRTTRPGPGTGATRYAGACTASPGTGGRTSVSRPGTRRPSAVRALADRRRRARRAAILWSAALLALAG